MGTIRHCVVPAAGLGTRFLPATKVLPKEMLPVVDRPVIEWAIEEAMAAGAAEMVLVIANGKELIQAHFERQPELEKVLEARGKQAELAAVRHSQELAAHPLRAPGEAARAGPRGTLRGRCGGRQSLPLHAPRRPLARPDLRSSPSSVTPGTRSRPRCSR